MITAMSPLPGRSLVCRFHRRGETLRLPRPEMWHLLHSVAQYGYMLYGRLPAIAASGWGGLPAGRHPLGHAMTYVFPFLLTPQ
jgi:hypothetical protein